jgi:hypothetical protein
MLPAEIFLLRILIFKGLTARRLYNNYYAYHMKLYLSEFRASVLLAVVLLEMSPKDYRGYLSIGGKTNCG